jgi:DNA invertase Pin-like site-specific DNA recombinase
MPPTIDWNFLLHNNYSTVFEMLSDMVKTMTYDEIAKKLGVGRTTLSRKIWKLEIFNPKSDPKKRKTFVLNRGGGRRNQ